MRLSGLRGTADYPSTGVLLISGFQVATRKTGGNRTDRRRRTDFTWERDSLALRALLPHPTPPCAKMCGGRRKPNHQPKTLRQGCLATAGLLLLLSLWSRRKHFNFNGMVPEVRQQAVGTAVHLGSVCSLACYTHTRTHIGENRNANMCLPTYLGKTGRHL